MSSRVAISALQSWSVRQYVVVVLAGLGWLVVTGTPTDLLDTPFFTRMTPPEWWNYPFWVAGALLAGLLTASYVGPLNSSARDGKGKLLGGGLLSVFAVGCPVCNKLVVFALGMSGALTYFAPVQPLLGILSVALLGYALHRRLTSRECAVVEVVSETNSSQDRTQT